MGWRREHFLYPLLVLRHEKFVVKLLNLEKAEDMTYGFSIPKQGIGHNASGAMAAQGAASWHMLDWKQATLIVKSLQARIVKAVQAGKWKRVRDLQRLLNRSTSAKAIAIRRVTENKGKQTAGIDGEKWDRPMKKYQAIDELNKPSKKNILNFLKKIKASIKKNATAKTEDLIDTLNPMIRGWANYHKMDNAKATFSYVDSRIFEMTWQ